jgi:hypothetical protein
MIVLVENAELQRVKRRCHDALPEALCWRRGRVSESALNRPIRARAPAHARRAELQDFFARLTGEFRLITIAASGDEPA